MIFTLQVLLLLGALGALDTVYYHEWKLRLPETPSARREVAWALACAAAFNRQ